MSNVFQMFGELDVKTGAFTNSLRDADAKLVNTRNELGKTEKASTQLGDTSATVARRYEKLNEQIQIQRDRLAQAGAAFQNGSINAKKLEQVTQQVDRATASLNSRLKDANARVKEIGDTGFTHFQNQIKGATSELGNFAALLTGNRLSGATTEITAFGNLISGATPALAGASASLTAIAVPAAIASAALIGTGVAAYETGQFLVGLAVDATKFLEPLKKSQEITGLSAETLSTLSYAAKIAGVEFSSLQKPLNVFTRNLADAAKGSDEARANLAKVGVTNNFNDLAGSTTKALDALQKTTDAVKRVDAASSAFGKKGGPDLINLVENMGTTFSAFQAKAKAAGLTLTNEDLQAADALGDAFDKLGLQTQTISAKIATGYMPALTAALDKVSAAVGKNEDAFRNLGKTIGGFANLAISEFEKISKFVEEHPIITRILLGATTGGLSEIASKAGAALRDLAGPDLKGGLDATKKAFTNADESESLRKAKEEVAKSLREIAQKSAQDQITADLEVQKARIAGGTGAINIIRQIASAQESATQRQIDLVNKQADENIAALTKEQQESGKADEIKAKAAADVAKLSNALIIEQIKARQAEQAEIKKTIDKLNELQKTQIAAVTGLAASTTKDNPIVQTMLAGEASVERLKESLKGLPAALIASQLAIQNTANAGDLFGAKLDTALNTINLRSQADKFRGATQKEQLSALAAKLASNGAILDSQGNLTIEPGRNADAIAAYAREQLAKINGQPAAKAQELLDQQLIAAGGARTAIEKARADRAITGLAGGLNPDDLRKDQREQIAQAFDRQANRTSDLAIEALQIAKETRDFVKGIHEYTDGQKDKAKQGVDLNINLKDDTSDKKMTTAKAATTGDVDKTYNFSGFGIVGGSNQ